MMAKLAIAAVAAILLAQGAQALPAFPDVRGRDLNGSDVATREHRGQAIAYLLGFSYDSRAELESWVKILPELAKRTHPERPLRVVQMPVLTGAAVWARPFIESGMAKNTPKAERRNVMTTTDRDALVKGLEISDPDRAAVLALVDAEGQVRLILRGGPTEANEKELAAGVNALP